MARLIPERLKQRLAELPDRPGVYFFKDRQRRPIYVGKALSIRKRVLGHFRSYGESFSKEGILLSQVEWIDLLETPTEAEALLLEASLVKELQPKYNQLLKDDKSYPYLKITAEKYPRLLVVRKRKADGGKYFGPYTSGRLLQQAVELLRRQFPMRTCRQLPKKVCLLYHIGQCGGPCEGLQDSAAYGGIVKELEAFLEGRREALVRNLTRRMKEHSAAREYEKAQELLEQVRALSMVPSSGKVPAGKPGPDDLADRLGLSGPPRRIECFDISNTQGAEAVGSMVVFIGGRPARSEYRRFRVKTVKGIDDYRMMREVVRRRYERLRREGAALPDLVVIDGGKGHLAAARTELLDLGLGALPILSIAKQHEHLFTPDREGPHVLPPTCPGLSMVRHLRDEAHRFAITYHRRLHKKESVLSALDAVAGIGPVTRQRLLKRFGSAKRIASLSVEELCASGGLRPGTARELLASLSRAFTRPA